MCNHKAAKKVSIKVSSYRDERQPLNKSKIKFINK